MANHRTITVKAPVNIALIKYWGKQDENLIIPLNDSISGTLSMDQLCATTTVMLSGKFDSNRMWLNGEPVSISDNKRLARCLQIVKQMVGFDLWAENEWIHICSRNNFPTAAGLASSAAGYACLMFALCKLFSIHDVAKISTLARLGSGSACRSVYGGFVQWITGTDMDSSIAKPICDATEWPEIRILVLVVSDHRKDTSSTSGMQLSCTTSTLIGHRATKVVPERVTQMITAINHRDFDRFAEITMRDSNQFHAICQDTFPPIRYMNDVSWEVVSFVHFYNQLKGRNVFCYTFDAGPNACLYCLETFVPEILSVLKRLYPSSSTSGLEVKGLEYPDPDEVDPKLLSYISSHRKPDALKYVISTRLGTGPQIISTQSDHHSLLTEVGMPKN